MLYAAGQVIRANEINALPQLYYVASDLVKNNSATFSDATGLSFPADANSRYFIECFLVYQSDQTRDIKLQWTTPSGTTGWWCADGIDAGNTGVGGFGALGYNNKIALAHPNVHAFSGENSVGINAHACPRAFFLIGSTAGTCQLQWAQFTAGAVNSVLVAGSCIRVTKVA